MSAQEEKSSGGGTKMLSKCMSISGWCCPTIWHSHSNRCNHTLEGWWHLTAAVACLSLCVFANVCVCVHVWAGRLVPVHWLVIMSDICPNRCWSCGADFTVAASFSSPPTVKYHCILFCFSHFTDNCDTNRMKSNKVFCAPPSSSSSFKLHKGVIFVQYGSFSAYL